MERLKAARYKIAGAIVSSNNSDGGLQRLRNTGDGEERGYNTPSLSRVSIILHGCAIFFTFLAICTMAAVAAFQGKWFGVCEWRSFGPGLFIFIANDDQRADRRSRCSFSCSTLRSSLHFYLFR